MKTLVIIFMLTLFACGQTNKTCSVDRQLRIGNIKFTLPDCYQLTFQDSINRPDHAIITKDQNVKLDLYVGGLGTLTFPKYDSSMTLHVDTIKKNYLRQIGYFSIQDKFGLVINIVDLRPDNFFSLLNPSDTILNGHQFNNELSAGTDENSSLTKEERDIIIKAFTTAEIIDK